MPCLQVAVVPLVSDPLVPHIHLLSLRAKVKNWVKELKKMLGNDIALTICGNKIDLEKNRTVDQATAEA